MYILLFFFFLFFVGVSEGKAGTPYVFPRFTDHQSYVRGLRINPLFYRLKQRELRNRVMYGFKERLK